MKHIVVFLLCISTTLFSAQTTATRPPASATEAMYHAATQSADAKFHHIVVNGASSHPDQTPTVITEREINAYLSSGKVPLPKGVSQLRVSGANGAATANALVDFDKVTEGKRSSSPLMGLFSGVHQVEVAFHGRGENGQGFVHIDSVSIDGIGIPRIALEYFVSHYITSKYPNLGLDSRFTLPDRINSASIGDHELSIVQK